MPRTPSRECCGIRYPDLMLVFMFVLACDLGVGFFLGLWVFLPRKGEMTSWEVEMHFVLTCIGSVLYLALSSGLIFWAYRFKYHMFAAERRDRLVLACALTLFTRDIPCWVLETSLWWYHGWLHPLQSIAYVLTSTAFTCSFVIVWLHYTWRMSRVIDDKYGNRLGFRYRAAHPIPSAPPGPAGFQGGGINGGGGGGGIAHLRR